MALPEFTMEEVAAHNSSDSLWLAIENEVYDVTNFFQEHPGTPGVILDNAGKDATNAFASAGHSAEAVQQRNGFLIGTLKDPPAAAAAAAVSATSSPAAAPEASPQASPAQCSCCGSENCRGKMIAGVGAVLAALVAVGVGVFLYRRYSK